MEEGGLGCRIWAVTREGGRDGGRRRNMSAGRRNEGRREC
jgi:hypothetical protein